MWGRADHTYTGDSGLFALVVLLRLLGVQVNVNHVRERFGRKGVGTKQMVRCARDLGLRARVQAPSLDRLSELRLPGIAALRDGGFMIVGKVSGSSVLILNPTSSHEEEITLDQLESIWDGRLVLMAHARTWSDVAKQLFATVGSAFRALAQPIRTLARRLWRDAGTSSHNLPKSSHSVSSAEESREASDPGQMTTQGGPASEIAGDRGLLALVMLLRIHGIGAEPGQIHHRCGNVAIGINEMLRCAKELGLKARVNSTSWDRLAATPLPAIAALSDGGFLIVGKVSEDKVLIQYPDAPRPEALSREVFEARWDGRLVLMARRASLTELSRRFDIAWFVGAIYKYRRLLSEVLVASFFLQLFALVSPLFFQVVIDKVLVHRSMSTLDVLAIGLLAISAFEAILGTLRTYMFAHTTNRIDVELGARLFRHLLALPIAYFQARRVGDSVARVRELENIRQFLTSSALTLVIDLFFTFVFLAVMFYYSSLLSFIVVAAFPFYIAISLAVTPVFRQRLDEKFRRGAENQAFLVESVTGIETLKAMAVEPQMQRRWEEQLAGYVAASFRVLSLGNYANQAVQLVNKATVVLILYFGAKLVIDGELSVGELVAFNMLSARVAAPVLRLAQMWQDFHQARLSVDRLGDILNTIPEPSTSPSRAALPAIRGEVTFEHVNFRYRIDAPAVLNDINLTIAPGQVVGVVGSSGSGKSTFAKLIQRLYVPESGRVMVDGVDLTMVDLAWLRRQVGVVLQENVLFNRSVRDNIALSDPAVPMDRVIAAAKLAGAHDFIVELPEGYDTMIGERGNSLSGGQRQRIAIARALMTNPRILIFDEATSALDYESERAIQDNMREIAAGRSVFIIAHRLSTVRQADRIITLERGRIVEDGSHDQLIRSNGRYAKLHHLQAGIR
ncbi:type I secretion system permease/ATPase [Bradyrhizobium macuxiense]|nr:type I secretion system permease/ATPase [Bradyrhizobium macuxiense]